MPHVDEGLLHAWLDGGLQAMSDAGELPDGITPADVEAHLRACADCRALLEQERAIRERAGLVLRDAAVPTIDAPPFEMISSAAPPRQRKTWLPLTWAASVLLAVGAGWWGSELWRDEQTALSMESATMQDARVQSGAETALAGAAQEAVEAPPSAAPAATRSDATSPEQPATQVASTEVRRQADENRDDTARDVTLDEPVVIAERASVAASAPPPASARVAAAPAAAPAQTFVSPTAPAASPSAPPSVRERVVASQDLAVTQSLRTSPAPADTPPDTGWFGYDPAVEAFRENVRRARRGEFEWQPLSRDELRRTDTRAVMIADGSAPLVDAAIGAVPSRVVRVRQTLASGEAVELMMWSRPPVQLDEAVVAGATPRITQQRRRAEEPDAAPRALRSGHISSDELDGGEREVLVLVPQVGTYVVIRGSMPDAGLRELAQRLIEVR